MKSLESIIIKGASLKGSRKIDFTDQAVAHRLKIIKEAQQSALQRKSVNLERISSIRVKV